MSVLIKGMKMPNNCMACDIEEPDDYGSVYRCPLIYKGYTSKIRQDGKLPKCPLVELPEKHGRLIDADLLKNEYPHDTDWDYPVNTNCYVSGSIDNAPTVIEAECE